MPEASLSIAIPVYNGAKSVGPLVDQLIAEFGHRDLEIVLVNDGSADESWQVVRSLAEDARQVVGVDLMRNFGQHNALLAAIATTRGDIVVTMDDDLQHPPSEVPKLLEELDRGYDVVYGTPVDEQHDRWRALASRITKLAMARALGVTRAPESSAFRAFRGELRETLEHSRGPFVSIDALLAWSTTRFSSVAVRHDARAAGDSNYTLWKLLAYATTLITSFSVWPLRLATFVGLTASIFGFFALLWVLGRYAIQGSPVPGFPFLASLVSILAGTQLFSLGILGEYLARVHIRSTGRPPYVVRERVGDPTSQQRSATEL